MRQEIEFLKRSVEFASSEKEPGQQGNENYNNVGILKVPIL